MEEPKFGPRSVFKACALSGLTPCSDIWFFPGSALHCFTCHKVLPPADLPWYYTVASPSAQSSKNNQFLLGADHLGVLIVNLSLFSMKGKHRV